MSNVYLSLKNLSTTEQALDFVKNLLENKGWVIVRVDNISSSIGAYKVDSVAIQILCDVELVKTGAIITNQDMPGMTIMREPGLYIRVGNIANRTREFRVDFFDEYLSELRNFFSFIDS